MSTDTTTDDSDSTDVPEFRKGDTILVNGAEYEITGVDPTRDGVRAYYLDVGEDAECRLEPPHPNRRTFTKIEVRSVDPEDIEEA